MIKQDTWDCLRRVPSSPITTDTKNKLLLLAITTNEDLFEFGWALTQWVKTWKNSNLKRVCVCFAWLSQRLKSTFFEIFPSLRRVLFGDPLHKKVSKNIDFSLWGKQCIVLAKMDFFPRFSPLCPDEIIM